MSDLPVREKTLSVRDATCLPFGDDLFELTLSHENKVELFKDAISKLSERSYEALSILSNLQKWNPTDASRFTLRSSLTILDTPFRLIFPNSALPSFDETGFYVRQYLAISYCWHSSDIGHGKWPISKPFVDAILADKDHPREGIWIDQLCIDQTSSVDKAKSIAAMDIIYRSCIRLVVLLEDVFLDEQEAKLPETYDPKRVPEGHEKDLFASFFHKVNAARWWTRAWCLHEFGVNDSWSDKRRQGVHNATFIVNGPNDSTVKIKWFDLHQIMSSALLALANADNNVLSTFSGQYIFSGVERGNDVQDGMSSSLMARHNGVVQKGSVYLADRLSILINMCGLALAYVGEEIQTEDEFLYFCTLLALAAGERYPLIMFTQKRSILFGGETTWLAPSARLTDTSIPRFALGGVRCVHRISYQNIELDMIFFRSARETVKDEDIKRTYAMFPEEMPPTQHTRQVSNDPDQRAASVTVGNALDRFRRRFLAGCILNGHEYMARFWEQAKRDILPRDFKGGIEPDPTLRAAAYELMAQLPKSGSIDDDSSQHFTVEEAHLFLTWLIDRESAYYVGFLNPFSLCCTSEGQMAFITAMLVNKEKFNDGPMEELRVAIPVDLITETCNLLRAWILRPVRNGNGITKWRLVGKGLLLGEPDLMQEVNMRSGEGIAPTVSRERIIVSG